VGELLALREGRGEAGRATRKEYQRPRATKSGTKRAECGTKSVAESNTVCMIAEVGAVNASVGNAASNRMKTWIARGSARQARGEFSGRGTRANASAPFSSRVRRLLFAKLKREKGKRKK